MNMIFIAQLGQDDDDDDDVDYAFNTILVHVDIAYERKQSLLNSHADVSSGVD